MKTQLDLIKKNKITKAFFVIPFHWSTLKSLFGYLHSVIHKFFWLQFSVKLGFRKIEVISVDNELDNHVPFNPLKVKVYLDFVSFWIRPMVFMMNRVGIKKAIPFCAEFFVFINKCYVEAAKVYSYKMSTTNRPMCKVDKSVQKNFNMIRTFDPHYLCVPSLHIAIVILAFTYYRHAFEQLGLSQEEQEFYNKELYQGALDIAETVLYIKQHSVNCIPAALYMMTKIVPEYFNNIEAKKFIDDLFVSATDVSENDKTNIHNYINTMFEKFYSEGKSETNWEIPVQKWIVNYKASSLPEKE